MTRTALSLALCTALPLAIACGDDDDDMGMLADAGGADGEAACLFEPPSELSGFIGLYMPPGDMNLELVGAGVFFDSAQEDVFELALYNGFGVFADGYAPGTYEITGAEADFYDCGVCVTIRAADGGPEQILVADGGTLEITELAAEAGGTLQATLTGATLREVTGDDETMTQTEVDGGCQVTLPTVNIDVSLMSPNGAR